MARIDPALFLERDDLSEAAGDRSAELTRQGGRDHGFHQRPTAGTGVREQLGISGCGLIIPLCIILGGVPLRIAIGTNTLLLITSTSSSFVGHVIKTTFYWELALILALGTVVGAFLGSRQHTSISETNIKRGFILILVVAAVWMLVKMVD